MSPVERVGLPYFKNYLNPNLLKNNDFLCIPVCDGIHFQGYVVNSKEKRIIPFYSLRPNYSKNPTSEEIATILFGKVDVLYGSYFTERKQFEANSCGVWLTAAITSFTLQLPVVTDRNHAFDIYYSLLECETPPNYVKDEIPATPSVNVSNDEQMKTFKSAEFLIPPVAEHSEKSESYCNVTPKEVRTNFFYVTDPTNADINADDNGAHTKSRNTTKLCTIATGQVFIVHRNDTEYYYSKRIACNSYTRVEETISVRRAYGKAKSFTLTRTVINISYPSCGPESPFLAIAYHTESTIKESTPVLLHGNTAKDSFLTKPYIRTNKGVLEKAKQMVRDGLKPKTIYDTININTGGVYFSTLQSNELRDSKQVFKQGQQP